MIFRFLGSDYSPPPPYTADQYRICTYFTSELIHALISGCLSFYLTYYVVSLLSGFITAVLLHMNKVVIIIIIIIIIIIFKILYERET